jgi:hypothetical protein
MKKLICMLALAGISYGTVYAAIPFQKHDTTRMGTKKKPVKAKEKEKKPVRRDTNIKV